MGDILTRVHKAHPIDTRYVAGMWHKDRLTWKGVWVELKTMGMSILESKNNNIGKFLIIGRARSGTTLLTQLLDSNPEIRCDREVLSKSMFNPAGHLDRLAAKSPFPIYGAKLLSYQMIQVQALRDPVNFLENLKDRGFKFIHISRNTFSQTLSLSMAQSRRIFHKIDSLESIDSTYIDISDFLRRLEWSSMLLEYERYCLSRFPHEKVSYEIDLQDSSQHQPTADRLFEWVGASTAHVGARLKKVLPDDPQNYIVNFGDLERAVKSAGFSHLLAKENPDF